MSTYAFHLAEGTCADMSAITADLQRLLVDLSREVEDGLHEWTPEARHAYQASKAKWEAAAAKMPETLSRAQTALTEISGGQSVS
jgi:uncharacterized protein YukE